MARATGQYVEHLFHTHRGWSFQLLALSEQRFVAAAFGSVTELTSRK